MRVNQIALDVIEGFKFDSAGFAMSSLWPHIRVYQSIYRLAYDKNGHNTEIFYKHESEYQH